MSGILEQILADVQAIKAALANGAQHAQVAVSQAAPVDPAAEQRRQLEAQLAALNGGGLVQAAVVQTAPANVTSEQLMGLITPHLDNAAIKEDLGVAMRAAGINALPEATPAQYGDLYQRFQAVIAKHTAGGASAVNTGASII